MGSINPFLMNEMRAVLNDTILGEGLWCTGIEMYGMLKQLPTLVETAGPYRAELLTLQSDSGT
jgi:hypothetical protein